MSEEKKPNYFNVVARRPLGRHDHFSALAHPMLGTYSAADLRRLQLLAKQDGNIGIGWILTERESITWSIYSKNEELLPEPVPCPGLSGDDPMRKYCTEFRILNGVLLKGDITAASKAYVDIYTDNAPCNSCAKVIEEFLTMCPDVKVRVMYRHLPSDAAYCDWPGQIAGWDPAVKCRCVEKKFSIPKTRDLFEKDCRYVFLTGEGENRKEVGRYRYLGIVDGRSEWEADGKKFHDVEFGEYDQVYRFTRNRPDDFIALGPSMLEQWQF